MLNAPEKGSKPVTITEQTLDKLSRPRLRWTDGQVLSQLDRILDHPEFQATVKMREFLRFVVEQTLAGNARYLKGFTIARAVYGRDETFDAAHDPVVRIQAGRLRRAIERYYLVAGGSDPIHIDIPKGGYVPVFSERSVVDSTLALRAEPESSSCIDHWPSVLILPFENLTASEELSFLGSGLAMDIAIELGNCTDLRVILSDVQTDCLNLNMQPDFIVRGSIRASGMDVKVVVQMVEGSSSLQLWTDTINTNLHRGELVPFKENAAAVIAAHIASEHAVIFRNQYRHLPRARVKNPSSYEAILRGYAHHQRANVDTFVSAVEALEGAHERDPDCGIICSLLAWMHFDNIALEFFDPEKYPIGEAMRLAHEGVRLEPVNQWSLLALARGHMIEGNLAAALAQVEAALALCPQSLLQMDAIGYLLVLLGEWDRGEQLIRKSIELNPFYRVVVRTATWLNCFRQGDYKGALNEIEWLGEEGYFWRPLCRAATLGQLDQSEECSDAVEELLALKPDFHERGLLLIRHYIKSPEIVERIVEGLAAGGLVLGSGQE